MKYYFLLILLIISLKGYSQNPIWISGIVKLENNTPLKDVHILNLSSNSGTISNNSGEFKIKASLNDSIILKRVDIEDSVLVFNATIFSNQFFEISLKKYQEVLNVIDLMPRKPFLDTAKREGGEVEMSLPFKISDFDCVKRDYRKFVFTGFGVAFRLGVKTEQLKMKEELEAYISKDDYIIPFRNTFDTSFFTEKLKIPEDEIVNFIEFFFRNPDLKKKIEESHPFDFIPQMLDSANVFMEDGG